MASRNRFADGLHHRIPSACSRSAADENATQYSVSPAITISKCRGSLIATLPQLRMRTARIPDTVRAVRYDARMSKPLFVPLKTRYFRAFVAGTKTTEYRRYGPRWNETTCWPGRPVTLSHGYSGARLTARVANVERVLASTLADPDPYSPEDELIVISLADIRPAP